MLFPADPALIGPSVKQPSLALILLSKIETMLAEPCCMVLQSKRRGTKGRAQLVAAWMQKVEQILAVKK